MAEIHKKINPEYFEKILSGEKTFEFRVADFECNPGDILVLEEWEYPGGINSVENRRPTGRVIRKKVGYVGYTKDFTWLTERPDVAADYDKLGAQVISLIDEPKTPSAKKTAAIDRNFAEQWLAKLRDYWLRKDIQKATELFKNTSFYQETPFQKPYTTFEEIMEEWQHVKDEDDFTVAGTTEGLHYVDFDFISHLNSEWFPKVRADKIEVAARNLLKTDSQKLYALDDNGAVSIDGNKLEVISDGQVVEIDLTDKASCV